MEGNQKIKRWSYKVLFPTFPPISRRTMGPLQVLLCDIKMIPLWLLKLLQSWSHLSKCMQATYYSASITSFWLAISPAQSLCCCGMFKAKMCIGICLFAADDLPKLWCAVTFWHLCISALNNVNSFSEHFDYLHKTVPMACDREEHSIH